MAPSSPHLCRSPVGYTLRPPIGSQGLSREWRCIGGLSSVFIAVWRLCLFVSALSLAAVLSLSGFSQTLFSSSIDRLSVSSLPINYNENPTSLLSNIVTFASATTIIASPQPAYTTAGVSDFQLNNDGTIVTVQNNAAATLGTAVATTFANGVLAPSASNAATAVTGIVFVADSPIDTASLGRAPWTITVSAVTFGNPNGRIEFRGRFPKSSQIVLTGLTHSQANAGGVAPIAAQRQSFVLFDGAAFVAATRVSITNAQLFRWRACRPAAQSSFVHFRGVAVADGAVLAVAQCTLTLHDLQGQQDADCAGSRTALAPFKAVYAESIDVMGAASQLSVAHSTLLQTADTVDYTALVAFDHLTLRDGASFAARGNTMEVSQHSASLRPYPTADGQNYLPQSSLVLLGGGSGAPDGYYANGTVTIAAGSVFDVSGNTMRDRSCLGNSSFWTDSFSADSFFNGRGRSNYFLYANPMNLSMGQVSALRVDGNYGHAVCSSYGVVLKAVIRNITQGVLLSASGNYATNFWPSFDMDASLFDAAAFPDVPGGGVLMAGSPTAPLVLTNLTVLVEGNFMPWGNPAVTSRANNDNPVVSIVSWHNPAQCAQCTFVVRNNTAPFLLDPSRFMFNLTVAPTFGVALAHLGPSSRVDVSQNTIALPPSSVGRYVFAAQPSAAFGVTVHGVQHSRIAMDNNVITALPTRTIANPAAPEYIAAASFAAPALGTVVSRRALISTSSYEVGARLSIIGGLTACPNATVSVDGNVLEGVERGVHAEAAGLALTAASSLSVSSNAVYMPSPFKRCQMYCSEWTSFPVGSIMCAGFVPRCYAGYGSGVTAHRGVFMYMDSAQLLSGTRVAMDRNDATIDYSKLSFDDAVFNADVQGARVGQAYGVVMEVDANVLLSASTVTQVGNAVLVVGNDGQGGMPDSHTSLTAKMTPNIVEFYGVGVYRSRYARVHQELSKGFAAADLGTPLRPAPTDYAAAYGRATNPSLLPYTVSAADEFGYGASEGGAFMEGASAYTLADNSVTGDFSSMVSSVPQYATNAVAFSLNFGRLLLSYGSSAVATRNTARITYNNTNRYNEYSTSFSVNVVALLVPGKVLLHQGGRLSVVDNAFTGWMDTRHATFTGIQLWHPQSVFCHGRTEGFNTREFDGMNCPSCDYRTYYYGRGFAAQQVSMDNWGMGRNGWGLQCLSARDLVLYNGTRTPRHWSDDDYYRYARPFGAASAPTTPTTTDGEGAQQKEAPRERSRPVNWRQLNAQGQTQQQQQRGFSAASSAPSPFPASAFTNIARYTNDWPLKCAEDDFYFTTAFAYWVDVDSAIRFDRNVFTHSVKTTRHATASSQERMVFLGSEMFSVYVNANSTFSISQNVFAKRKDPSAALPPHAMPLSAFTPNDLSSASYLGISIEGAQILSVTNGSTFAVDDNIHLLKHKYYDVQSYAPMARPFDGAASSSSSSSLPNGTDAPRAMNATVAEEERRSFVPSNSDGCGATLQATALNFTIIISEGDSSLTLSRNRLNVTTDADVIAVAKGTVLTSPCSEVLVARALKDYTHDLFVSAFTLARYNSTLRIDGNSFGLLFVHPAQQKVGEGNFAGFNMVPDYTLPSAGDVFNDEDWVPLYGLPHMEASSGAGLIAPWAVSMVFVNASMSVSENDVSIVFPTETSFHPVGVGILSNAQLLATMGTARVSNNKVSFKFAGGIGMAPSVLAGLLDDGEDVSPIAAFPPTATLAETFNVSDYTMANRDWEQGTVTGVFLCSHPNNRLPAFFDQSLVAVDGNAVDIDSATRVYGIQTMTCDPFGLFEVVDVESDLISDVDRLESCAVNGDLLAACHDATDVGFVRQPWGYAPCHRLDEANGDCVMDAQLCGTEFYECPPRPPLPEIACNFYDMLNYDGHFRCCENSQMIVDAKLESCSPRYYYPSPYGYYGWCNDGSNLDDCIDRCNGDDVLDCTYYYDSGLAQYRDCSVSGSCGAYEIPSYYYCNGGFNECRDNSYAGKPPRPTAPPAASCFYHYDWMYTGTYQCCIDSQMTVNGNTYSCDPDYYYSSGYYGHCVSPYDWDQCIDRCNGNDVLECNYYYDGQGYYECGVDMACSSLQEPSYYYCNGAHNRCRPYYPYQKATNPPVPTTAPSNEVHFYYRDYVYSGTYQQCTDSTMTVDSNTYPCDPQYYYVKGSTGTYGICVTPSGSDSDDCIDRCNGNDVLECNYYYDGQGYYECGVDMACSSLQEPNYYYCNGAHNRCRPYYPYQKATNVPVPTTTAAPAACQFYYYDASMSHAYQCCEDSSMTVNGYPYYCDPDYYYEGGSHQHCGTSMGWHTCSSAALHLLLQRRGLHLQGLCCAGRLQRQRGSFALLL